ncbi:hypothetical protein CLV42_101185 [Chitinophaga ginsengisoli]|uniref:Uncharacterized protein n=1 Tax=Chitinophaga ginsengisoli TaxID=363837 RepID=A0A2P8GNA9_9BACT|nr:hypothetical protein CLV42_101185 [Chitinophaga ginsengisoli]
MKNISGIKYNYAHTVYEKSKMWARSNDIIERPV